MEGLTLVFLLARRDCFLVKSAGWVNPAESAMTEGLLYEDYRQSQ